MLFKSPSKIFLKLFVLLNCISCSDGSEFGTSTLRLSSSENSSPKTLTSDVRTGSNTTANGENATISAESASPISKVSSASEKSSAIKVKTEDETEMPSVEVAGVNLVPDCISASNLKTQPSFNSTVNLFEVNCSMSVSKTSKIDIYGAKIETTDAFGRKISLRELRRHVSVPSSSKKFELIFLSSEEYSPEALSKLSKVKLKFDKILVDNKSAEDVRTYVSLKQLNHVSNDCPPESQLRWQKQTLTWENNLELWNSGTQSEWNARVDYMSPRLSALAPKEKLPDLTTKPLCGARFSGPLRKIKTDGKPLEADRHFYTDRFIFLLNSSVLAADDLIKPLGLTSRPTLLNLYDPTILLKSNMSNILPQSPTAAQRTIFGNQRFSDIFCAGTKDFCFANPVGGWVNEFSIFNAQYIPPALLRSLLEKQIRDGLPIDFGIHLFGNGNSFVDAGESDGLPIYMQRMELDLELAF